MDNSRSARYRAHKEARGGGRYYDIASAANLDISINEVFGNK